MNELGLGGQAEVGCKLAQLKAEAREQGAGLAKAQGPRCTGRAAVVGWELGIVWRGGLAEVEIEKRKKLWKKST
jgi:hypothetical protein